MMTSKKLLAEGVSPFGLSHYFGFPNLSFLVFGKLSQFLGGITLNNFRLVHGFFGLLIVLLSYLFFRQSLSPFYGLAGAAILASNHALLGISRMAMRDNSGLLLELAALTLLLYGLRRKSRFLSFLGGALAGLTFYVYYPARITIFLWGLSLLILLFMKKISWRSALNIGAVNLLGFIIAASPILVATTKSPGVLNYQREQFLIFPEGQKLEKEWTNIQTTEGAVRKNIVNGLTAFNSKIHDQGYIYPNYGHGFLDPLTGILIWIGLIIILRRREKTGAHILAVVGFLTIWLVLSLLVTKAPHYTRLLTVLPFVSYLALFAIKTVFEYLWGLVSKFFSGALLNFVKNSSVIVIVIVIVISNLTIFGDFAKQGLAEGNDVGSTARYVEARKNIPNYKFYLVASKEYPYYSWGEAYQWKDWLGFFASESQKVEVLEPENFLNSFDKPPFTIFMRQSIFRREEAAIKEKYPDFEIHNIKTDGSLVALEIL